MNGVSAAVEPESAPSAPPRGYASRDPAWLRQARALVGDLHQRSPLIYWLDFLLSVGTAWALAAVYFTAPAWSVLQIATLVAASILFYRSGTFIHELVHMPPGEMVWFGRVWNLLQGVPLLMPWIFYRNHVDHHSARYFGSPEDGEYLPLAAAPLSETLRYMAQAPLLPVLAPVRLGILGPLSWFHPGLREWVLTATSAAVSNPFYRKRFPRREERHLLIIEALCFAYLVAIGVMLYTGVITGVDLFKAYVLLTLALTLNWVRNLASHRYANAGDPMTYLEQFDDSINIVGQTWLTALMFPVGLRYHAVHHLFPTMPYHNLGKAHRRLSEQLPADCPYHATGRNSAFAAIGELLRSAWRTPPERSAMRRWRAAVSPKAASV